MIAIGSDHGGYKLKKELKKYLEEIGLEYKDVGTNSEIRTDYPIFAKEVGQLVSNKKCEKGILICRSGHGMEIAANKFKGVRAASITNEDDARMAKSDDNINVLCLGADCLATDEAIRIMRVWIATEFKGGRYKERLDMIEDIEKENMK